MPTITEYTLKSKDKQSVFLITSDIKALNEMIEALGTEESAVEKKEIDLLQYAHDNICNITTKEIDLLQSKLPEEERQSFLESVNAWEDEAIY